MHTLKSWSAHPGRNPAHRFGQPRERFQVKVFDPRQMKIVEVTRLGPRNPSRWLPHQGEREQVRRRRQIEAGQIKIHEAAV